MSRSIEVRICWSVEEEGDRRVSSVTLDRRMTEAVAAATAVLTDAGMPLTEVYWEGDYSPKRHPILGQMNLRPRRRRRARSEA